MKLYLITGFLGAGKTTFIKNLIRHFSGEKIYLIINEFGREGIDAALLSDLGAAIDEINNGSIFCTCRQDQFESSLLNAVNAGPDLILVEASGLSDPTNIRKILSYERYAAIDYQGGICLVDAMRLHKVYDTARVVKKQLAVSNLILLNKTDKASDELIDNARRLIAEANSEARLVKTTFGQIEPEILADLPRRDIELTADNRVDLSQHKYLLTVDRNAAKRQLEGFLSMVAEDTYRIKGIVFLEGRYWLVDCVSSFVQIFPYDGKLPEEAGKLIVLSGKGMPARKSIKEARDWYPQLITDLQ